VRHITDYLTSREIMMDEITEVVVADDAGTVDVAVVGDEVSEDTAEVKAESEEPAFLAADSDKVPLKTLLKQKGKLRESRTENEELRARLQSLEQAQQPAQVISKRPKERDFETDEAYDEAMDNWDNQRFSTIQNDVRQTNTQNTHQANLQRDIGNGLDRHYQAADELCSQHNVDPAVYKAADSKVREAMEAIRPQQGDMTVDLLITKLKKGSEKVVLYLGRNDAKLAELQNSLVSDPTGLDAMGMLGSLKKEIEKTTKKRSSAPPPAVTLNGSAQTPSNEKALKKAYEKAEGQEAFKLKRQASKAGFNTKEW
jgi:hypothetical protein